MNEEDLYKTILGQICSGMIASGRTDDNQILEEAKIWANVIMKEKYNEVITEQNIDKNRIFTGYYDANGTPIFDGDIFVYNVWVFNQGGVPDDIIENYQNKYSNTVELHPVFWDSDEKMWASDVYGDCDRMGKYDFSKLYVVTNFYEHSELYNH